MVHLDLDGAWLDPLVGLSTLDVRRWGPALRFTAPAALVKEFAAEILPQLGDFTLYGSGDFHYLSALWSRRMCEPFVLVSFDNHPDWDVRPPRWACGGWMNRALELRLLEKAVIWGCGNFECWWPGQIFGNRAAERQGKLELHVWGDARPAGKQKRHGVMFRRDWREQFKRFVRQMRGRNLYLTIDLDCLTSNGAVTNWESGFFETADLVWALRLLRGTARIVGGDICGAYSEPKYARAGQRFIAEWDHPKLPRPAAERAREINFATLQQLWPALTEGDEHHASRDQE